MMPQVKRFLSPHSGEVERFIERLGFDAGTAKRVVIDIDCDNPIVVVYVQMYASEGALEILTNAELAPEIKVIE